MSDIRLFIAARIAAVAAVLLGVQAAHAQQRAIVNSSFESNDPLGPGAPNYQIYPNGVVVGWNSTSGEIELWDNNYSGVPAYDGAVYAEMNASAAGALYQTICMVGGETVGWSFAHRARSGGAPTQTATFEIATTSGTVTQTLATQSSTINNVWNLNTGSTTYTGPSGMQRVQFTTTDPGSFGNFLDDIRINLNPFIEFNGGASSGVESIASANIPALIVSGTLFTPRTVTVTITGGTATRGTDYTTPTGTATFTVTIPAGVHQGTNFPLGIIILNDGVIEGSETIQMSISSGTGYTIAATQSCGATPVAAATYTITDDDSPVTLTKNWVTGIAGDAVALTISGGTSSTAGTSTSSGSATNATAAASAGQTLTLTEAFTTGSAANYNSTLDCRRASDNAVVTVSGSGLSRTAVMPTGSNMTCTWTNTRKSATLTVRKTWANAKLSDGTTVMTSGLINNPSLAAVANAVNETDSATAVTVYAAEAATFSESFFSGSAANYNATLACTGNATALSGLVLTVSNADTAIVCTYTNARRSASLQLRKTWAGATINDAVNIPATTGFTNNTTALASIANTANESDNGTAVTVYAGDVGTLRGESFTTGAAASYQKALSCTGGALSGTDAQADNTLTVNGADGGTTIVCVYTNTTITPLLVAKSISVISDGINVSNPKLIPGATVRYCVLITNPSLTTATVVTMTDALPPTLVYVPATMLSGTTCAGAATVEDDNAAGADESDPFGMSIAGVTITGVLASLGPSGTFAMVYNALIN